MIKIKSPNTISGKIFVPGDKSISHRGLILASMAEGISEIYGLSSGNDVQTTQSLMKKLGVEIIQMDEDLMVITSRGWAGLKASDAILDCENSGTSARLLTAILAGHSFSSVIDGDESLRQRPMGRVVEPLRLMGADITSQNSNDLLPLEIQGKQLHGIDYLMPIASAQVKSAILLAGLNAEGETSVTEPFPSRDHTERFFSWLNLPLERNRLTYKISPSKVPAFSLKIPGDFSSAAYFVALGLIHPNAEITISDVNLNPTRAALLDVLRRMGGYISLTVLEDKPELVGEITVRSSELKNTTVDVSEIPAIIDELPLLAVVATQAEGTLKLTGAQELRVKESDRISALVPQLRKMGANIDELPDGFIVEGLTPLKGAKLEACKDHRIAMSLAIAATIAEGKSKLAGDEWVKISFPDFFKILKQIGNK